MLAITAAMVYPLRSKKTPQWMQEQVLEDLNCFSKEDLNPERIRTQFEHLNPNLHVVHIQVKDNQIYWQQNGWGDKIGSWRTQKVCRMLFDASQKKKLPDVSFLITMHDGLTTAPENLDLSQYLPLFTFAKTKSATNAVLFPDPLTAEFAKKRIRFYSRLSIEKLKPQNAWAKKIEKAFWRGSTTGGQYLIENWRDKPRVKLALLSKFYPDDIDAGLTQFCQMEEPVRAEIQKELPQVDWVSPLEHLKYKYLVIADGNTCTYPRLLLGLISGSVVFKDATDHYQWFYRILEPNEHYVEVEADFSNLPEKVQWAKDHDTQARKIAQNAQKLAKANLKINHIHEYISTLLNQYSMLQGSEIKIYEGMQKYMPKMKYQRDPS